MEFWGVEVKAGEKYTVQPEFGQLIHISQASLGEVKDCKGAKNIPLRMKIGDKNFIIGTLAAEDRTQIMFDLVFEKEFELSHDWKNGSVYFLGYIAEEPASDEEFSDADESDEELVLEAPSNGVAKAKSGDVKPAQKAVPVAAKAGANDKAKKAEPESDDDDDDEDDSDFDSDDEMAIDGLPQIDSSDEDGSDEDEDESDDEETPKVVQQSKKRSAGSEEKTPNAKKAKAATPEKSGKKGQNATPVPSKPAGKTPNKKDQTPKAGEKSSCKSCSKSFSSDGALQSHNKAKHGGK